jgi:hypothetical protein
MSNLQYRNIQRAQSHGTKSDRPRSDCTNHNDLAVSATFQLSVPFVPGANAR